MEAECLFKQAKYAECAGCVRQAAAAQTHRNRRAHRPARRPIAKHSSGNGIAALQRLEQTAKIDAASPYLARDLVRSRPGQAEPWTGPTKPSSLFEQVTTQTDGEAARPRPLSMIGEIQFEKKNHQEAPQELLRSGLRLRFSSVQQAAARNTKQGSMLRSLGQERSRPGNRIRKSSTSIPVARRLSWPVSLARSLGG